MIGDGCASFLSLRLGEGKREEAQRGVGNAIVMVVVVSIALTAVFLIWIDPILTLFGATDALRDYALAYGKIIGLSLPFMMIPAALNAMIRADGSPKYAMVSMILGAAVNTALDPIFIFCFSMGVEGAAIATVIGQAASFVVSFLYLFRFQSVKLHLAALRPEAKTCRTVLSLGISSFITQIAITIVMALSNNLLAHYGALGTHMYIYTGGEPLVRKADLMTLCRRHPDCEFLAFTNGTLIDEAFCQEMLQVKNFVPAISLEGFSAANDSRRGQGVFDKVQQAMKRLRSHRLPFGISTCYTRENCDDISSDLFFDMLIQAGALFTWFFHYMPVGTGAAPDLLPTPAQRKMVYERIRHFRQTKPLFTMDFQNDAEFVGGCIAGGRKYLHINAAGDVEPCVFIHYSNVNIHEHTLLEALKSPLFMAYHNGQPFHDNMLRPCPMLENPACLREMVTKSGAKSTDLQSTETVDQLCGKCQTYAQAWAGTAEQLWRESRCAEG